MNKQLHNLHYEDISVRELRHLIKAMTVLEALLEKQHRDKSEAITPVNYSFGPNGNLYTYIRKG